MGRRAAGERRFGRKRLLLGRACASAARTSDEVLWRFFATAALRKEVVPRPRTSPAIDTRHGETEANQECLRQRRLTWTQLLMRVWAIDVLERSLNTIPDAPRKTRYRPAG